MDTSKHFSQLHGVNAAEKVVLRKKLRRKEMVAFFKALAPTVIGIEACGAAHYLARLLGSFGHEVKLIAPQLVKPYVKRGNLSRVWLPRLRNIHDQPLASRVSALVSVRACLAMFDS